MKIKFIKEYCTCFRDEENMINTETFKPDDMVSTSMEEDRYFTEELARWLINNGFAEEVKESGWWRPSCGDRYYFIDDSGYTKYAKWQDDFWEVDRYRMGNVFKTEAATARYGNYLKAIATVRQDEGVLTPEQIREKESWHCDVYYIWKTIAGECRVMRLDLTVIHACPNAIFFYKAPDADASLEKHPDEWKTILDYDWSRE